MASFPSSSPHVHDGYGATADRSTIIRVGAKEESGLTRCRASRILVGDTSTR